MLLFWLARESETLFTTPIYCSKLFYGLRLTINHRQSSFVQEAEPAVFKQPNGQNGEGEEQDKDEQVGGVLPMALLSLLLRDDILHGTVLLLLLLLL